MNQKLCTELQDEISANKNNEKKICFLVKELEQYYQTILFQDKIIIAHKNKIEELKIKITAL